MYDSTYYTIVLHVLTVEAPTADTETRLVVALLTKEAPLVLICVLVLRNLRPFSIPWGTQRESNPLTSITAGLRLLPRGASRTVTVQCRCRHGELIYLVTVSWCFEQGSNLRHPPCKSGALPTELSKQRNQYAFATRRCQALILSNCSTHTVVCLPGGPTDTGDCIDHSPYFYRRLTAVERFAA